ncbi:MAG TPA: glycosyltransferase [Chthonomonadales bacterium]|nr:glycosyltransferase [Chthonomonadales bacterium]
MGAEAGIQSYLGNANEDVVVAVADSRWEEIYSSVPLLEVPWRFQEIWRSPFMLQYLRTVLRLCPRGSRTLETGIGSGFGAIWLSKRGCRAAGIDSSARLVERAKIVNNVLGGSAVFEVGDLFDLGPHGAGRLLAAGSDEGDTDAADGECAAGKELAGQRRRGARKGGSAPGAVQAGAGLRGGNGRGARFRESAAASERYAVVHHQGVLEHYDVARVRRALAQQVTMGDWVVFSVPSVYYPYDPEFGDERLLTLEAWQRILEPFRVEQLEYYGDDALGAREHVLCVVEGERRSGSKPRREIERLMRAEYDPYEEGITAIVHTRNEERNITDCLRTLVGKVDGMVVCDMESSDGTVKAAESVGAEVVRHPEIQNFDRSRNVSAVMARHRWILYVDADERVPEGLLPRLRKLLEEHGSEFDGLMIPFRHFFAGRWMRSLYPGYTAPRLLRNGRFVWGARPHSGCAVDGRLELFAADDPALALEHYSYDSVAHIISKR